jgi:copper chaperone
MTEFNVPGMSCGGCASRVTKAVQAVDPAARVQVDLGRQTVSVDSTADRETLSGALKVAGYPPH